MPMGVPPGSLQYPHSTLACLQYPESLSLEVLQERMHTLQRVLGTFGLEREEGRKSCAANSDLEHERGSYLLPRLGKE